MTKKYVIYCLFLLVFSLGVSGVAFAVPASPEISEVFQPNGTVINVRIKGDEWNSRIETVDGYVIAKAATGIWYHISRYEGDTPVLSTTPAHELPAPAIQRHIRPAPDFTKTNPNAVLSQSSNVNGISSPMAAPDMVINTGTFNGKILFILAEFTDRTGTYSEASFASFISNNISDYFNKASYDKVTLQPASELYGTSDNGVIGWVNLGYAHPNTGNNTGSLNQQLTKDAIVAADPYINYASFDTNGDSYVDANELAIVVIAAGYEAAWSSGYSPAVWGHKWSISSPPNVDGVVVGSWHNGVGGYAQFGEIHGAHQATMGVMVHELGHLIFGLPDLYDTDYSSFGVGIWSLMSYGSWGRSASQTFDGETPVLPDAWSKYKLGWVDGTVGSGDTSIVAAGSTLATSSNSVYKLITVLSNEYFLVENRQSSLGYDAGLQGLTVNGIGGLAIWHIDDNKTSNNAECYPPNDCTTNHYMVALEQADGLWNLEKNNRMSNDGDMGDLFPGNSNNLSFTDSSTPNSRLYNGGISNVSVTSISASSSMMTAALLGVTQDTLNVSKFGAGSGTIISTPPGIDCGVSCSTTFINGTVVTLTAIPNGNSLFAGWGGDCSGTVLSTSVTMNSGKTCTATFIVGLTGEYYNNSDLTGLGLVRTDPVINFDWGTGSPDPAIYADTFSVRWTGKLQVDHDETYTFNAVTDDGVRLWLDGYLVLDYWQTGGVSLNNTMYLTAGLHDFKVEFFEDTGAALAQLYWSSPSTPYAIIPNDHLYPPDGDGSSPVLEWSGGAGFSVDGVEPETGDTTTMFNYRVKYSDTDGNFPMSGFPRVHILKGGVEIGGSPFSMSYLSGGYTVGSIYSFSTTLSEGTDYTYYFDAVDNTGRQAVATPVKPTPTAPIDAPDSKVQEDYDVVTNGGFDAGTSPWVFYTNGAGTFANDAVGDGSAHAAHINITTPGTNVQMQQSGLVLEANTQYRLSFKAYSNTGHDVSVSLQKHVSPYTNYGLSGRVFNLTTGWQSFAVEFTTTGFTGTVTDGRLMFWFAPYDASGDHYYLDDVVLEKVIVAITPPQITTHPVDKTVVVGYTATFSVAASGTAPLSYQWQKNGMNIAGATSAIYMTPATVIGDSGATFRCIVTNAYGSATSDVSTLHVNGSWRSVGPDGGGVSSLVISPSYATDQTIIAWTYNGVVFKSTNGGRSWRLVSTGLIGENVSSLSISPNYAVDQTLFAGTSGGVFKSTNGGESWSAVNIGLYYQNVSSLSVSPNYAVDQTLFAGTYGSGVFKSMNGGESWSVVNTGLSDLHVNVISISPNYATDQTLFAGTGSGVLKSTNGGVSWSAVSEWPGDGGVASLSISPAYAIDQTLFAGTYNGAVFKSTNGGGSWSDVNTGLIDLNVPSLSISSNYATDQTIFVVGHRYSYGASFDVVYKSTNGGGIWSEINTGLSNIGVSSLSISPNYAVDQTLFAETGSGVFKSTDGGGSWSDVNTGLSGLNAPFLSISPAYVTDQTLFVWTYGSGAFKSTDGGWSWSDVNTGIGNLGVTSLSISPAFAIDRTLFAGTNKFGVFKSTNGGVSWNAVNTGLKINEILGGRYVIALSISPFYATDQTLFVVSYYFDRFLEYFSYVVYKSTDGGENWSAVSEWSGDGVTSLSISPAYATDQTLFLGTYNDGVFKSTDGGENWSAVSEWSGDGVTSLSISPAYATDQTLFAGTYNGTVFKSTNGGGSWSAIYTGLNDYFVDSLSISPAYATDQTLFLGTYSGGVLKSTNGGESWNEVNTGLGNLHIGSLSISPNYAYDGILFAGTNGSSVWKHSEVALGGFESGTTPWVFYTDGAGTFLADAPGNGSPNAGHITIQTPGANVQMYETGIELEANTQYRLSFKAYSNTGHDLSVSLLKHLAPYTNYGLSGKVFDLTTAWQAFTFDFTTAGFVGTVNDGRLMFWLTSYVESGDEYFFDDIVLEKVIPPAITGQPSGQTVAVGQAATFSVVASGTSPLSYQWQKNAVDITGATSATYTTPATVVGDSVSIFRCIVTNAYGSATSNTALMTVTGGVTVSVITNGGFETGTSPWVFYTNGAGTLANDATGDGSAHAAHIKITTPGTNVQMQQSGLVLEANTQYRLSFKAYSNTGHDVSVSLQQHGSPYTNYGLSGRVFNLTTGWQSFAVEFTTTGFTGTVTDGRLMFWFAPYDASGDNYYFDDVVLEKVIVAITPPQITTHPADKTVVVGYTATFSVVASGTAPLSYQWQRNGVNIAGATGEIYMTPATVIGDSGATFRCIVTNAYGSATSNEATLHVNGSWASVGPDGGGVSSLVISPSYATDQTIIAWTYNGVVFKSTNGGRSWRLVNTELIGQQVSSLSISPNYAVDQTLFAGTSGSGVFKSTNGGVSWSAVNIGLYHQNVSSLSISPNYAADQTLFAVTQASSFHRPYGVIYSSTDGGESWSQVTTGLGEPVSVSISPNYATDRTLFACGLVFAQPGGIVKSTNGGVSWSVVNTGLSDLNVYVITISPNYTTDQTLFAETGSGVFKSTNGGESWSEVTVNVGLSDIYEHSVSISPNYATDQTLFAETGSGVFKSTDGGESWSEVTVNVGLSDIYEHSVSISPNYATDQTLFAETGSGVFKSTDGGESWSGVNTGLDDLYVSSLSISPNYAIDQTLFAGTSGNGILKSTDGGESWSDVNTGLDDLYVSSLSISPSYAADQTLFAGTFGSGVFKSTNGGESWSDVNTGLDNLYVSLSISPNYAVDQTLFAGTHYSAVFKSTNGGGSWSAIYTGLNDYFVDSLSISPAFASDQTLFLVAKWHDIYSTVGFIYKSTDGGASWSADNTELSGNVGFLSISPNYAVDQTLFAGTSGSGVLKSIDGGVSWSDVNTGLDNLYVSSLSISPNYVVDQTLFAGTSGGGVFKSLNGGVSWSEVNTGLSNLYVSSLFISPNYSYDGILFAGTNGSSVWKYSEVALGGFESGTTPWVFYTDGAGAFLTDAPGDGSPNAGHITIQTPGANVQMYETGIELEANTQYRLSFKAYSNSGHDLSVSLLKHLAPYTNYGLSGRVFDLTTAWQEFTFEFTTTGFAGVVTDGRLMFWLASYVEGGDEYFFDDIVLEKVTVAVVPPAITAQPANQTVVAGQTAVFTVAATGTAPLSYQWQKNGVDIPGATSATYTTPATVPGDSGATFRCIVTNAYGSATSNTATLTVTSGVTVSAVVNGGFETGTNPWVFYTNGVGTFTNDAAGDGSARAAHIKITTPGTNVQMQQSGLALEANTQYRLSFKAYSNTGHDVSVSLQKRVSPYTNYGLSGRVFNLTTSWQSFTVEFTTTGFAGSVNDGRLMFWLAQYDASGDHYYFDDVALEKVTAAVVPPAISTQPANQTVSEGQTAVFTVAATGTAPLSYQWQRNGVDISGATSATYTTPATVVGDSGATFRCIVTNAYGNATSDAATLTVTSGVTVSVVVNGGFETGTSPWVFYTNGAGTFANDAAGDGSARAAHIKITTPGTNVQMNQAGLVLEANTQYRLSFKAYSNTGHDVSVSVQKNVSPYTGYGLSGRVFNLTTAWQAFTVEFTTAGFAGTVNDGRLMFWLAPYDASGDHYYFDDVVLEKIGTP